MSAASVKGSSTVTWRANVVKSPLDTSTNFPYRSIGVQTYGVGLSYTQFSSAGGVRVGIFAKELGLKMISRWGNPVEGNAVADTCQSSALGRCRSRTSLKSNSGFFSDATRTAQKALDVALAAGRQDLAAELEGELKRYEAGLPYHQ